jgi:hypothetical protein
VSFALAIRVAGSADPTFQILPRPPRRRFQRAPRPDPYTELRNRSVQDTFIVCCDCEDDPVPLGRGLDPCCD